jgi:hypothetical protein
MKNITFIGRWCRVIRFAGWLGGSAVALQCVSPAFGTPPVVVAPPKISATNGMATSAGFFEGISRRSYLLSDM